MIRFLRSKWFGGSSAPTDLRIDASGAVRALPTDAAAALGQLELIARVAVDGLMSGKHRSMQRGGTSDFAEHRQYGPGDDIRRIDWKLHARNDRYHIRTYEDETNLRSLIVVDVSGSMNYSGASASKFDCARTVASSLARLLMRQRDSVGMAVIDSKVRAEVPAGLRPSTLSRIQQTLADATIQGDTDVPAALQQLRPSGRRRGMLILISDCFADADALRRSLSAWSAAGHDVLVIELLAPEEIEFSFRGPMVFDDLEFPGRQLEVDAGNIRQVYLEQFANHRREIADAIRRSRASHFVLTTDQPLNQTLREFLIRRTALQKAVARSGARR